MDIRGPRLRKPSDKALEFTSSMAWDGRIARHVIAVNTAHMAALISAGEVDRKAGSKCIGFLLSASPEIPARAKAEDFHQFLEQQAVDSLGVEIAGFLNYGKSRNDQVATAIRMELRERISELVGAIAKLQQALLKVADEHGTVMLPGYTHLQRAQPVTLAHHFLAYFDAFQRDAERGFQLYARANLSPMGSAAMAGTSLHIDRTGLAKSLGFSGPVMNAMDAVSSRDIAVEALSFATITMLDASRLAEELILWSSSEFGFVEVDDAYAASSSIMPQKKNPVPAEMVRAKAGSVLGSLVAACTILKALPNSYNLDLQEVTPHLWRGMDDSIVSVGILAGIVGSLRVISKSMHDSVANDNSTAVGLANYLVKEHGVSFRQAHTIVGELVRVSAESGKPLSAVAATKLAIISAKSGKKIVLDAETLKEILEPENFLGSIFTLGGSNPNSIKNERSARQKQFALNTAALADLNSSLRASERKLKSTASGLAREVKSKSEH